jgi:hypothetical protein
MSPSAYLAITEAVGDKDQGGPPKDSGSVAIAFGLPAVTIDSSAVPGAVGPPEGGDEIVVDHCSKHGQTGRKFSIVWEYLTNDISPNISNTLPFVTSKHYMSMVSTEMKSELAVIHLNSCASFKLSVIEIHDECYPDWFAASTLNKSAAGRASFASVPRSVDSRMFPCTQTSIAKFTVTRLSMAINWISIAVSLCIPIRLELHLLASRIHIY